jgi:hypothetical protein
MTEQWWFPRTVCPFVLYKNNTDTKLFRSSYFDPLYSTANCTRDLPYLKQLGINTVRVYSVNSSLDHDGCMGLLEGAGIYLM